MLSVKSLQSGYNESMIIQGISLDAPEKKITTIMGSNGVGKTTFLKAVMGVLPVSGGSVHFDGIDVTHEIPEKKARRGIGYVPQGRFIFPYLTVRQNLLVGLDNPGHKDVKAKMQEIYTLFPALEDLSSFYGGNLSGGQQQQLAIARVLMMNPRLLILDEPTEGIQPSIIMQIADTIRFICEKYEMAILLVEQNIHFALEYSHSYCVFGHGSIIKQGNITDSNRTRIVDEIEI